MKKRIPLCPVCGVSTWLGDVTIGQERTAPTGPSVGITVHVHCLNGKRRVGEAGVQPTKVVEVQP